MTPKTSLANTSNVPDRSLTLTIDDHATPLTGRLANEAGEHRSFRGWLGLAAALESLLNLNPPPQPAQQAVPAPPVPEEARGST